jgi:hypothetical protein
MALKRKVDDISREEDFRDYEERDIDEGWPYDDAAGAGSRTVDNMAYGQPQANFDEGRNGGYQVDGADFDGQEERLVDNIRPVTKGVENADDLEERITDALDALGIADMDGLDLHVIDGEVTISGVVDDQSTSRRIETAVERVAGVRLVVNHLRLAGVDSRIPDSD